MEQNLVINCGKFRIVAEIYPNNGTDIPPEMCVYLEDQEFLQFGGNLDDCPRRVGLVNLDIE